MSAGLKPCPHCGGDAYLDNAGGQVDGRGNYLARVFCGAPDCDTLGTAWLEDRSSYELSRKFAQLYELVLREYPAL